MTFMRTAVGTLAALALTFSCAAGVFAAYDADNTQQTEQPAVTTTTQPQNYDPTQSAGNDVTSWNIATTTTYAETTTAATENSATSKPATLRLDVGEVKDGEFEVKLNISSEALVSNASLSVSYDNTLLEYAGSEEDKDAGGMAVENNFDGKYVYNYVNKDGSDHSGTFITLKFKIIDETMVSTVLYLSVTSLDDNNLIPISFTAENGIVNNPDAKTEESAADPVESKTIEISMGSDPVSLADLGINDVKECQITDGEAAEYKDEKIIPISVGTAKLRVTYNDDSRETFTVNVLKAEVKEAAAASASLADKNSNSNSTRNIIILGVVTLGMIAVIAEYIIIMKPFGNKAKKPAADEDNIPDESGETTEEMLSELEKAIAAKNERAAKEREENDLSDTQRLNKELIAKGFIISDDSYDDDE